VKPIACLITDRRRLREPTVDAVVRQVRHAAAAGVQLVQIRERDLEGRRLCELARRLVEAVSGTATRIIVNDRLDVALAAGAHGVHLRGGSFAASRARRLVPAGFLVGRSVHASDDVSTAARGADYLAYGNVYETASKPGLPAAGLSRLAAVVRATSVPVLAVGGVSIERIPAVLDAGAVGFAAISMFSELDAQ
jgi:thiamine-phosphate diphosphorylase